MIIDDRLITDTINSFAVDGAEVTLQKLKGKDYELDLLSKIASWPSLSWADQVLVEEELHNLRQNENGINKGGKPSLAGKVGWSQVDTAKELGISIGGFSQDLSLARALKENPDLRKVKDKRTALRLIRGVTKREIAQVESLLTAPNMDQILLGDSNDILKLYPDKTFDACITDPPWSSYKDPELCADAKTLPVFKQIFRTLKNDGFLYVFLSSPDFISYSQHLASLGFKIQEYPLIWHKTGTITHGRAPWQYARDFENILLAVKGAPSLTSGMEPSAILQQTIVHNTKAIHPHEKPNELIKTIVRHCSFAGGKILDPFAGSGVLAEVCKETDRRFVCIERDPKRFAQIEKRINGKSN